MSQLTQLTKVRKQFIDLTPTDIGALPKDSKAVDSAKLEGKTLSQVTAAARAGLALASLEINGHALTASFNLTAADVGAAPASHTHDYIPNSSKGANNGVATLDGSGKIPQGQLPAIAIKETFVVTNQTEMLALSVQTGDMAVRTDVRKTFVLMRTPATVIGNWQELLTPTDTVTSVNGATGAVTITAASIGAEPAFAKKTAFNKDFGTTAGTVMQGNDTRVLNAVQNTLTVNGHRLNANVVLDAADVGALATDGTAKNAAKLDNTTKADIISAARSGLAASGTSYTKAESDNRYLQSGGSSLKEAIISETVSITADATTVALTTGKFTKLLAVSIGGIWQSNSAWSFASNTITFGGTVTATADEPEIISVIGFK